jgi:Bacterial SH3 domain
MGQLKLRPDAAKASGRYPAVVLGDPKPIAQRFAHSADLRQAALRRDDPPRASQPAQPPAAARGATASAGGRLAVRTHLLIAGLILAALVPSLILVAIWLGLISMPGSKPAPAEPAPQTAAPSAVLTAPDRIEAITGEDVSFPIALDGTDGVPPRSIIAIRGLPQGSNFSEGRPYGGREWNLKPDQIGDLALVLPANANGEFKLGIALIAPDDGVIAEAETLLEITPAPAPVEQAAPEESSVPSPDGSEAAVTAPVPDGSETTASAPVPDVGHGDGAEMEEKPAAMEVATAPSVETPSDKGEQRVEEATAPSGDTRPNAVGQAEDGESGLGSVEPSVFVNMREGPSSSAPVLGVIAKGTKLSVLDRKRGWVQVTDPATGKKGWIYSGLLAGEAKTHHRRKRVAPAEAEPKPESFWGRLGRWLSP